MFVSPEMKIPVTEFQARIEAIKQAIKKLEEWVDACKSLREWSCAYKSTFHNSVGTRIREMASGQLGVKADQMQAYMDRLQLTLPTLSVECFTVPEEQTRVTQNLEKAVGILESYLASSDVQEASATLSDVTNMLDQADRLFQNGIQLPHKDILWEKGACPASMWAFSASMCCPVKPESYDPTSQKWTTCPVKKQNTVYQCGLTKDAADGTGLPVCHPDVRQGPCGTGQFFYGASRGGFCCPLQPTGFDEQTGEYTQCGRGGRGGCGLDPVKAEEAGIPACSALEGFSVPSSLRGRDLLDKADALLKKVDRVVASLQPIAEKAQARQTTMLSNLNSLALTVSAPSSQSS